MKKIYLTTLALSLFCALGFAQNKSVSLGRAVIPLNLNNYTVLTISAWVKPGANTGYSAVYANDNGGYDIALHAYNGEWRIFHNRSIGTNIPYTVGEWYHTTAVFSPTATKFYINGQLVYNGSGSSSRNGYTAMRIGSNSAGSNGHNFNGEIDELQFWNYERSQEQIYLNRYQSLNGTEAGLLAYYSFDSDSFLDETGNGNNATSSSGLVYQPSNIPLSQADTTIIVTESACRNYTWAQNGMTYYSTGIYRDTIASTTGTDSIVFILSLSIDPKRGPTVTESAYTSYTWPQNGVTYTETGLYSDTITSIAGCDSISILDLTILLQPFVDSCETVLNFDGIDDYVQLTNSLTIGSGSNTVELWVKVPTVGTQGLTSNERVGIILGNYNSNPGAGWEIHDDGQMRLWWQGTNIYGTTDLRDNLWHHIAYVMDKQNNSVKFYIDGNLEKSDVLSLTNYTFTTSHRIGGDNRNTSGGPSFHGAMDEFRIWNVAKTQAEIAALTISKPNLTDTSLLSYFDFNERIGSSLTDLKGTNNGVLTNMDTILDWSLSDGSNPCGFDTTSTPNLIVLTVTESACENYTWAQNGMTYNVTGMYNDTIFSVSNTDSVITTLDLTINNSNTGTDTQVACDSYTWIDGVTYTASNNTATFTLQNAANCDSVVTLDLTINNSNTGTDTQVACDSYTWIDGVTYTASNNAATFTLQNAANCDSVVTLDLTINQHSSDTVSVTRFVDFLWPQNGITYTATGMHYDTIPNAVGCDSVITLDLTISILPPNDSCETVLNFDGINDYVQLATPLTIGSSSNTVEVRVKVPLAGTEGLGTTERVGNILGNYNGSPNSNWEIHNDGQLRIYWNGGQINSYGTRDLRDNQWHHIAFVRNISDNTFKAYIDGALEMSLNTAGSNLNFNTAHRIGGDNRSTSGGPSFHGAMDELRIWNVAKTQSEIATLGTIELIGTESNLISYYNFDEAAGSNLTDISGTSNGTLINMSPTTDWTLENGNTPCNSNASSRKKSPLQITDIEDENSLSIYPNPTNGEFTLDLGHETEVMTVSIMDYTGKLISRKSYSQLQKINLNIDQAAGIYMLRIELDGEVQVKKIIKQ